MFIKPYTSELMVYITKRALRGSFIVLENYTSKKRN